MVIVGGGSSGGGVSGGSGGAADGAVPGELCRNGFTTGCRVSIGGSRGCKHFVRRRGIVLVAVLLSFLAVNALG